MSIKKVGNNWYVHISNFSELINATEPFLGNNMVRNLELAAKELDKIQIIKMDRHDFSMSFIQSPDWFTAYEPVVGDSVKFDINGNCLGITKGRIKNKQIYHSKELFMADDFNQEWMDTAKARTKLWNTIPNIKELKRKIGNQDYWIELLNENNIPV